MSTAVRRRARCCWFVAGVWSCCTAALLAQSIKDPRVRLETWVSGLTSPTMFAWIEPGQMLVLQKDDGHVAWIADGVVQGIALDLTVDNYVTAGALGIAPDPDFAHNHHVYIYYSSTTAVDDSSDAATWLDHRVERFDWNGSALVNRTGPLIAFPTDPAQNDEPLHCGGPLRFGPDGMLYGQTGDMDRGRFGGFERVEMNTATSGSAGIGGIFRIARDGTIPQDNPFVAESDPSFHVWWSYGLRNGFGLAFDPLTGILWDTENGPDKYDEVNRVPKGMNSGWLKIMGPDARDATYAENGNAPFDAPSLSYLGGATYLDPELSFFTPIGITAIEFLHSKRFPEDLRELCIFGDTNFAHLYSARLKPGREEFELSGKLADKVADPGGERAQLVFGSGFGIVTDLQLGADGYLYLADYKLGAIFRMRPVTDLVEPAEFKLRHGMSRSGASDALDSSDDRWLDVSDRNFTPVARPFVVDATFTLAQTDPTAMGLDVEDHAVATFVQQDLYVRNVVTGGFDLVDSAWVGGGDELRSIALANPAQYVDPVSRAVDVRIVATRFPRVAGHPHASAPLTVAFDLVRIEATFP